jgi:hypothetical protein
VTAITPVRPRSIAVPRGRTLNTLRIDAVGETMMSQVRLHPVRLVAEGLRGLGSLASLSAYQQVRSALPSQRGGLVEANVVGLPAGQALAGEA